MSYSIVTPSKTTTYRDPLTAPLYIANGETLSGTIEITDNFAFSHDAFQGVVCIGAGVSAQLSDVIFPGKPFAWWDARKTAVYPTRAVSIASGAGTISVDGLDVQRFYCGSALAARDYAKLTVKRMRTEQCASGIALMWPYLIGNLDTTIDGFTGRDMAATNQGSNMGPSILFPGQMVGDNFLYSEGCGALTLRNIDTRGEGKGVKCWRTEVLMIDQLETQQLWLGGDLIPLPSGYKGTLSAQSVAVDHSLLGGSVYGMGINYSADAIPLFVRFPTATPVEIRNSVIVLPRPGAHAGNPGWRFEGVAAQESARVHLANTTRLIDLRGDLPDPNLGRGWVAVETGGVVQDESRHERFVPQWLG